MLTSVIKFLLCIILAEGVVFLAVAILGFIKEFLLN